MVEKGPRHEQGPLSYEHQLIADDNKKGRKNRKIDGRKPAQVRSVTRHATRDHIWHTGRYLLA